MDIRSGVVTVRDVEKFAIRVVFPDQDNKVSDLLKVLVPTISKEYEADNVIPQVGEFVVCMFDCNGDGYCAGAYRK